MVVLITAPLPLTFKVLVADKPVMFCKVKPAYGPEAGFTLITTGPHIPLALNKSAIAVMLVKSAPVAPTVNVPTNPDLKLFRTTVSFSGFASVPLLGAVEYIFKL